MIMNAKPSGDFFVMITKRVGAPRKCKLASRFLNMQMAMKVRSLEPLSSLPNREILQRYDCAGSFGVVWTQGREKCIAL